MTNLDQLSLTSSQRINTNDKVRTICYFVFNPKLNLVFVFLIQITNYLICFAFINIYRELKPSSSKRKMAVDSSEDEYEKVEREREEDLKERDEFSKRLLEKDKEKQRNVMSKSEKKVRFTIKGFFRWSGPNGHIRCML